MTWKSAALSGFIDMTNQSKSVLQALFQTGDTPNGSNYSDLIDSSVNLAETSAQTMIGAIISTEFIGPRVSATNVNVTGTLSATAAAFTDVTVSAISATGNVSAASLNVTGDVSAATGTVYASAMRSTNGLLAGVGIVSAAGSAQATAAVLTNVVNRGKGVVDGQTTGFMPLSNRAGLVQYLFNEGVSANLWPPVGGTINGLATNAAFSLAASAMVTIVHLTASAMAVK